MRDQAIHEGAIVALPCSALVRWQRLDLRQALRQPVRNLYIFAGQFARQLDIVVARRAKRLPTRNHPSDERDRLDDARPPVNQITYEDSFAPLGVAHARLRVAG